MVIDGDLARVALLLQVQVEPVRHLLLHVRRGLLQQPLASLHPPLQLLARLARVAQRLPEASEEARLRVQLALHAVLGPTQPLLLLGHAPRGLVVQLLQLGDGELFAFQRGVEVRLSFLARAHPLGAARAERHRLAQLRDASVVLRDRRRELRALALVVLRVLLRGVQRLGRRGHRRLEPDAHRRLLLRARLERLVLVVRQLRRLRRRRERRLQLLALAAQRAVEVRDDRLELGLELAHVHAGDAQVLVRRGARLRQSLLGAAQLAAHVARLAAVLLARARDAVGALARRGEVLGEHRQLLLALGDARLERRDALLLVRGELRAEVEPERGVHAGVPALHDLAVLGERLGDVRVLLDDVHGHALVLDEHHALHLTGVHHVVEHGVVLELEHVEHGLEAPRRALRRVTLQVVPLAPHVHGHDSDALHLAVVLDHLVQDVAVAHVPHEPAPQTLADGLLHGVRPVLLLELDVQPDGPDRGLRKLLRALAHQVHQLAQFLRAVLPGELVQELAFVRARLSQLGLHVTQLLGFVLHGHLRRTQRALRLAVRARARLRPRDDFVVASLELGALRGLRLDGALQRVVLRLRLLLLRRARLLDGVLQLFPGPLRPRDLVRVRHRVGLRAGLLAQERRLLLVRGVDVRDQGGGFSLELGQALLRLVYLRLAVRDRLRLVADVRLQRRP